MNEVNLQRGVATGAGHGPRVGLPVPGFTVTGPHRFTTNHDTEIGDVDGVNQSIVYKSNVIPGRLRTW